MIPSKQPHASYMQHMKRFFAFVTQPVLFFTDRKMFKEVSRFAGKNITFRIIEFKSMEVFKEFPQSFWETQVSRDAEFYHTWQLAALWANKKYFIKEAASEYPDMDWFVWIDAGSIRKDTWKPFLENFTARNFTLEPSVYMQVLDEIPESKLYFVYPNQHVAGALILFHRECIQDYIKDYNTILRDYDKEKIPGSSDQYIMASLINKYPRWIGVLRGKVAIFDYVNSCPDPWYFFISLI
jgi:hypothetical protein